MRSFNFLETLRKTATLLRQPAIVFAVIICLAVDGVLGQTCVSEAVGVPFAPGPPKWWDSTPPGSAAIFQRIDDPRWKRAAAITHGSGATEQVSFRALHHTDGTSQSMYFSWWAKVAPSATATDNLLYVGLKPSGVGTPILIKVNLTALNAKDTTDYAVSVHAVNNNGTFGPPINPDPAWTNNIRIWANTPMNTWAIHVNVPIGSDLGTGFSLGPDFNMWYEVLQGTPAMPTGVIYTWPRGPGFSVTSMAFVETVPMPANWPSFHLNTGPADPVCQTGGITIEAIDIGTNHPSGAGYISKTLPNTFFAKPTNKTAAGINIGDVHARFRLANWGTQPDPNDIPGAATNLWKDIPGLGDVTQSGAGSIAPNAQWNITGTWTLNPAEQAEFDGVNRWDHQCMLVELSGPNLVFLNNSVHRNMNFVTASRFQEQAQVSVIELPVIPGSNPNRDVYLYVQTFNMPRVVTTPSPGGPTGPRPSAGAVANNQVEDERPQIEKLTDTEPTLIVHGYYDTGEKVVINGTERKMLRPLTSFGYFVKHQGSLKGWRHSLTRNGQELTRVGPNFYKLSVPQNGAVTILTTIEAIETDAPATTDKRFGFSLHGGVSIPHGILNDFFNPGPNFAADFEYRLGGDWSLEGIFGYHRFNRDGIGDDFDIYQFSGNIKYFVPGATVRPFLNFGGGAYNFDPGPTRGGINFGGGLLFNVTPNFGVEGAYNFHNVFTSGSNIRFSTAQAGVRFRF